MDSIEFLILKNLLHNEEYVRKVIPFIKADYFEDLTQKIVFEEISSFVEQYNKPATKEILCIFQSWILTFIFVLVVGHCIYILSFVT